MLVEFDQMPDAARLWVYQANRALNEEEAAFIRQYTEQFLAQWQAHGNDLKSSYQLEYNQFLVISVDESYSEASGCSIDASVHLIKALEEKLGISFITSGQVAFMLEDQIKLFPFNKIKSQIEKAVIRPETTVFDNTVKDLGEFKRRWKAPSDQSWIGRYFQ